MNLRRAGRPAGPRRAAWLDGVCVVTVWSAVNAPISQCSTANRSGMPATVPLLLLRLSRRTEHHPARVRNRIGARFGQVGMELQDRRRIVIGPRGKAGFGGRAGAGRHRPHRAARRQDQRHLRSRFRPWADAARAADAARGRGETRPLLGLPITVKESYNVAGLPTTWGFPAQKDFVPAEDALSITRVKQAGAVILGKTNVPLGLGDWQSFNDIYGTTSNPYDLGRTPGGSSGGLSAALAAGDGCSRSAPTSAAGCARPRHFCWCYPTSRPTHWRWCLRAATRRRRFRRCRFDRPHGRRRADGALRRAISRRPARRDRRARTSSRLDAATRLALPQARHASLKGYRAPPPRHASDDAGLRWCEHPRGGPASSRRSLRKAGVKIRREAAAPAGPRRRGAALHAASPSFLSVCLHPRATRG